MFLSMPCSLQNRRKFKVTWYLGNILFLVYVCSNRIRLWYTCLFEHEPKYWDDWKLHFFPFRCMCWIHRQEQCNSNKKIVSDYIYTDYIPSRFQTTCFCQAVLLNGFHNCQDFLTETIASQFRLALCIQESCLTAAMRGKVSTNRYKRIKLRPR